MICSCFSPFTVFPPIQFLSHAKPSGRTPRGTRAGRMWLAKAVMSAHRVCESQPTVFQFHIQFINGVASWVSKWREPCSS